MDFEQFYNTYFNRVFAYIRSRSSSAQHAEEAASIVWQKVYKNFDSYDSAKGLPEQWLFTTARNTLNSLFRYYKIRSFISLEFLEEMFSSGEKDTLSKMQGDEDCALLFKALAQLSKQEKDLVALKYYSGLNNREIAKMTGLGESNVGTILNRCTGKLRELLEDSYE